MHRKVLSVFFIIFTSIFCLFAEDDEWYWDQPISKIDFVGLKNVKKSDLNGIVSSYIDKPFTDDSYNEILDRLYALDYFDEINPYAKHASSSNSDVLLVFEVVERPVIKSIVFSGNKKIRNGELRDQIKIKASDVYVESKVLVDERLIRNHYISKGYNNSQVTHTVEEKEDGIVVTFKIDEGASSVIKEINFMGNTIVSSRTLKRKLNLKEVGFLKDGAYQPSTLEMDKQVIVAYYKEHGYADAAIVDVKMDSAYNEEKQRNELSITFVIIEGFQYTYRGLTIKGNEVFSDKELLSSAKLKEGAVYNETKFQEDLNTIQSIYYENGYMSNGFYPVPSKDSDRHEISYELTIQERARSHVENIIIKGNTKTKDYVIRREIPIETGDVFSRDKIISAMRNLMNLQYFSSVIPDPQQGSEENLVDIVWSVEEQSTSVVQFGLTFSGMTNANQLPVSLYLKLENSNLFGEGRTISTGMNLSNTEQTFDLSYSQNWIGDLPIGFSQTLSLSHENATGLVNFWTPNMELSQRSFYMNYQGWNASLTSGIARRWASDYAIVSLAGGIGNSLKYNIYDESLYVPVDKNISAYANRWGLSNYIYTSLSVDNRDISYDSTSGWFASERLTWHGLVPGYEKEFFLNSETKLEGYLKLLEIPFSETYSLKFVLAGYTGLSAVFPTSTGVSEANKVYIDGMFNGRGWTDVYKETKGLAMLSNRLELRVPVVPNVLGFDGFFDAAASKATFNDLSSLNINDFYFSYGPGIRFLLPQFPLHLLFAWRFKMVDGQPKFAETPFQFVLSFNVTNR